MGNHVSIDNLGMIRIYEPARGIIYIKDILGIQQINGPKHKCYGSDSITHRQLQVSLTGGGWVTIMDCVGYEYYGGKSIGSDEWLIKIGVTMDSNRARSMVDYAYQDLEAIWSEYKLKTNPL